ncbi:cytochrome P450 [Roridomyces roridus]|uniref:Cytochrome P450 n=1 Tax=Roridomyces roridus TaxID=1738132 RepID=A0AAD7CK71_9AGAR|nr:cytochrome P450 [Roridomyces roridus]
MLYNTLLGIPHMKVQRLHERYGPIVQIGPNTLSFVSTTAIKQIYSFSNAFDKSSVYELQHMDGSGLFFFKDKASHALRRRILNRSFSEQALSQYHEHLVGEVEHLIRCLLEKTAEHGQVDLTRILPQYAFDNINTIFFSGHAFPSLLDSDDPTHITRWAASVFELGEIFSHVEALFHLTMCIPGVSKLMPFGKISVDAAERRLRNGPAFRDGISYWFDGGESQPKLDASDLPIETETILLGDAVGGVLVLMFYFLIESPKWLHLLRGELEASKERAPTQWLLSLDKLDILNAVIQEGLRLGTPLPGFPRVVPDDGAIIDGHHVPGGTSVSVPIWGYHLSKEHFSDPTTFDPDRWIEDGRFSSNKGTLFAFTAGPFGCAGQKLAYAQLRILLALVVFQLDIVPTPEFDPVKFWNGVRNRRATTFPGPFWVRVAGRGDRGL